MNILNFPEGFLIAVPATAESILRAMQYLEYYYGVHTYYTTLHICGKTAYIQL